MKEIGRKFRIMLLTAAAFTMWGGVAQAGYTITDLGTLGGGTVSNAYGINNSGQVVGRARTADNQYHAFLWTASGGMQNINATNGSSADAINNAGQVSGHVNADSGFIWSNGTLQSLGSKFGCAINSSGQVAGYTSYPYQAYLWTNGDVQYMGTLGGTISYAYDVNDSGQVIGSSGHSGTSSQNYAYVWTASGGMQEIPTLGGGWTTSPQAINNAGQMVGYSNYQPYPSTLYHAFLWTATGGMQDLGTLGGTESSAFGINELGQVVGYAKDAAGAYHTVLWDHGQIINLDDAVAGTGWTLYASSSNKMGINDLGQIVGTGRINGKPHAFLLTPDAEPVPIPAAAWLLGSGLMGLVGLRRRMQG